MPKREFSEAEKRYLAFKKRRTILSMILLPLHILDIVFIITDILRPENSYIPLLVYIGVLALLILIDIPVGLKFSAQDKKLRSEAYGDTKYERSRLFQEIWDEYENDTLHNGIGDKHVVFEYVGEYQNTLELDIHRRGHRIYVRVGEEGVHFLIDETDPPIEQTVPLSELGSLEAFYTYVREFLREHS